VNASGSLIEEGTFVWHITAGGSDEMPLAENVRCLQQIKQSGKTGNDPDSSFFFFWERTTQSYDLCRAHVVARDD
jgi:hypothetical protein|tara:strand:+ start:2186 stop:2410 length:225 start_codon:yes stop_codon:yes gene_type:complete